MEYTSTVSPFFYLYLCCFLRLRRHRLLFSFFRRFLSVLVVFLCPIIRLYDATTAVTLVFDRPLLLLLLLLLVLFIPILPAPMAVVLGQ